LRNMDNQSATVLIFKCSLLCNNIPIATHKQQYRSIVATIRLSKQRATENGVFWWSDRGPPQDNNRAIRGRRFSQQEDSDQFRRGKIFKARVSLKKKRVDCTTGITSTIKIVHRLSMFATCGIIPWKAPAPVFNSCVNSQHRLV
jgi:hypothetical protein